MMMFKSNFTIPLHRRDEFGWREASIRPSIISQPAAHRKPAVVWEPDPVTGVGLFDLFVATFRRRPDDCQKGLRVGIDKYGRVRRNTICSLCAAPGAACCDVPRDGDGSCRGRQRSSAREIY